MEFAVWCGHNDLRDLADIETMHVAAYIETLQIRRAASSVKQSLAAIRMLFDWLVIGQVIAVNRESPVRGPKCSVKKGKTPVLSAEEARRLLDSIDPASSHAALRDRALIALMVYTSARIGAALKMRVEDVYVQKRRSWVRLHEKGGKRHEMPCHHNLETYLHCKRLTNTPVRRASRPRAFSEVPMRPLEAILGIYLDNRESQSVCREMT